MGKRRYAPPNTRAQQADGVLADIVLNHRRPSPPYPVNITPIKVESDVDPEDDKSKIVKVEDARALRSPLLAALVDYSFVLTLVFGGCCSNVWAYEYLLKINSSIGTALTFSQMSFITLTSLPYFIDIHWRPAPSYIIRHQIPIPSLKPRQVPLSQWVLQVLVLTAGSLLNNWAFAFHVPLSIQIVFRSAGLAVSMLFGRLVMKKQYSFSQVTSVFIVTFGVILATTSRPMPSSASTADEDHFAEYTLGITMLTLSLFLTGTLGLLQERTYAKYGPCWREGVFYTHALALPIFSLFVPQIQDGFASLSVPPTQTPITMQTTLLRYSPIAGPYLILFANLATQLVCVTGVNQLTSRVSSVSTNLVLTTRKAISLLFSVWWFGNGYNGQLGFGAGMVFLGSVLYGLGTNRGAKAKPTPKPKPKAQSQTPEKMGKARRSPGRAGTEEVQKGPRTRVKEEPEDEAGFPVGSAMGNGGPRTAMNGNGNGNARARARGKQKQKEKQE